MSERDEAELAAGSGDATGEGRPVAGCMACATYRGEGRACPGHRKVTPARPPAPDPDQRVEIPRAGETWKWLWLGVEIIKAGPRRVTYRTVDGDVDSSPTDRFLSRFHRTGVKS